MNILITFFGGCFEQDDLSRDAYLVKFAAAKLAEVVTVGVKLVEVKLAEINCLSVPVRS